LAPELLKECSLQCAASLPRFVGVDDAGRQTQLITDEPERLTQVGIVSNEDSGIAVTPAGVEHQVSRERNVGPLLLGLDDLDCLGPVRWWVGEQA
jgi:hypothetical protein